MSRQASAWMPIYIGDYLGDTQRLTTEQHGAYLLLIFDYWRNGPAPDDDAVLQQITRLDRAAWKKHRPTLARLFQIEDGEWRHKRVDAELARADTLVEQRRAAGKASAEARARQRALQRKGNDRSTSVATEDQRNGRPSPSPSPDSVEVGGIPSSSDARATGDDDDSDPVSLAHSLCRTAGVSVSSPKAIATAAQLVRDWQQAGATPDLMSRVIADALPRAAEPVHSLRYFNARVLNAIALEAQGHDPLTRNGSTGNARSRGGAGGFARMVAASMGS